MATLHACRRFATPNYLTPEPQIEIWGYRLSSLRDYTKSEIGDRKSEVGNQIAGDRVRAEAEVGVGGDRLQGTGFRLQELGFGERAAVGARAGMS